MCLGRASTPYRFANIFVPSHQGCHPGARLSETWPYIYIYIYIYICGNLKRPRLGSLFKLWILNGGLQIYQLMSSAYGFGHISVRMAPGICLRAYGSGHIARGNGSRHMAPGMGRQAYGPGRAQETVRVQRLVVHDLYVGDPKVSKPVCAQRLVNGVVHRCFLRIAICYEHIVCATLAGKLAVKRVQVQRLVNRGCFLKQAPAVKPGCG